MKTKQLLSVVFCFPFFLSGCFLSQLDTGYSTSGDRRYAIDDHERAYNRFHPEEAHIEAAFGWRFRDKCEAMRDENGHIPPLLSIEYDKCWDEWLALLKANRKK